MSTKRQSYSGEYKGKIALEALREFKTLSQISSETGIHPNQIRQWKQHVHANVASLFTQARQAVATSDASAVLPQLYEEIGRLKMEMAWLKKT